MNRANKKLIKHLQKGKSVFIVGEALSHKVKNTVKVHFSSATNEWATPQYLFKWLDDQYHFTLDPCCTHETAKCVKHFTLNDSGLTKSWGEETVFMNPPYGREIGIWIKKAYEASLAGATVVCLIPARTDTKWWYDYCLEADNICFLTGRVKFIENGISTKDSAPFPSAIVTFQPPHSKNLELRCWWRDLKGISKV